MKTKLISRRNFIYQSTATLAGFCFIPSLITASPNSIVNVAVVGVGGRGMNNWTQMTGISQDSRRVKVGLEKEQNSIPYPHVKIVAICDVDDRAASTAFKLMPKVKRFKDFRVMMDDMSKDIDAVIISTPDHTHFAATMCAMEMGKHVYVEKPLAHNIWQLRTLKKAAEYYGVVTQLGNQGHASDGIRNIKEWYDLGLLGKVEEVHAWFNGPKFGDDLWFNKPINYPPSKEPIPYELSWDLWLGPAKERPYSHYYLPKWWRSYFDFGTGMLGDWGCHTLDAPFWTLEMGKPISIEPIHSKLSPNPILFGTDESILKFVFAPRKGHTKGITMYWYEGGKKPLNRPEWYFDKVPNSGMIMIGSKQSVYTGGKPYEPQMLMPEEEWKNFEQKGWEQSIRRIPRESPHDEFIDAIRGLGPKPGSSFEYGADLTEVALLGALAQRFNAKIEYDDENMKIKNQPALNAFIKEEVRVGWAYGEHLWK